MIKCFSYGVLDSNTYVVYDKGEAMLVDCGVEPSRVLNFIRNNALTIKYIVLTHGHYDHVYYVGDYAALFPTAKLICHEDEIKVLLDSEANASALFDIARVYDFPYEAVRVGHELKIGSLCFSVLHTPGHSPGGICLYCESERVLLAGDMIFYGGYGRTDFKYGSVSDMRASLRALLSLDPSTTVYSGHGRETKIGNEL